MKPSVLKFFIVVLFILSGICGLIYEVAWSKYLALFIGSTAYSHMIVLATFMGGLAFGSFYWGRYADKAVNQLRLYGILEIAIGIYCFAYPFFISAAETTFIGMAESLNASAGQVSLLVLKFLLSFITLILPTFFMGGTLPVLTKYLTKNIADAGKDVATLYYINSLGAIIGTALAGFFLIRYLSLDGTVWSAASMNLLIGGAALLLAKWVRIPAQEKIRNDDVKQDTTQKFSHRIIKVAIAVAAFSGFIAMLYELTWIRLLSNILGSSTYSFSVMLIAFISGITLGSWIVSRIISKIKNLFVFLGFCQFATAVSMILTLPLYERLPYYLLQLSLTISNKPGNFPIFLAIEFLFCLIIMIVPTTFSGMSLPVVSRIASNDIRILGKTVGSVFSINTIGTVVGALLTGLVLIPLLGVKQTIEIGVLFNGLLGLTIFFLDKKFSVRWRIIFVAIFILLEVGYWMQFPEWNKHMSISGVFRRFSLEVPATFEEFKSNNEENRTILSYKEGVNANVAVIEIPTETSTQRTLIINGKADASTEGDLQTQILLAQVPLMMLPDTGDALVIGLGSGVTCGSALVHPLRSLDCVEISSEVVEAVNYFGKWNNDVIKNPRLKLHLDDAITYLKITPKQYDFIISEPSNPWIAGIGNLFSSEFFELSKKRLRPGGILTQWFHTYDLDDRTFKLIVNTICRAFPYVSIWRASDADVIILASVKPITADFGMMEQKIRIKAIEDDLARIHIYDIPTFLSTQVVSSRNNIFAFMGGEINSEKKPLLEFMAPIGLFTHSAVQIVDSLDERMIVQDKNLWISMYEKQYGISLMNYLNIARYRNNPNIGDLWFAYSTLKKCLQLNPRSEDALGMMARITRDLGLKDERLDVLRRVAELFPDDVEVVNAYAEALLDHYAQHISVVNNLDLQDVIALYRHCIALTGGKEERFIIMLGGSLRISGKCAEAAEIYKSVLRLRQADANNTNPESEILLLIEIAENYFNAGYIDEAQKYVDSTQQLGLPNEKMQILSHRIALSRIGIK
jgi:spermidine synthase